MKLTESAPVQPIEVKRLAPWVIYRDAAGWVGVTPLEFWRQVHSGKPGWMAIKHIMARDLKDAMRQKDRYDKR